MERFNYYINSKIHFGFDSLTEMESILTDLKKTRILLISDPGLVETGIVDKIVDSMSNSSYEIKVFSEVEANPRIETIEKAAQIGKEFECDCIIGAGGGSSIDTAKLTGLILTYGGNMLDYEGPNKVPGPIMPVIAIPTTAGTASEVTPFAIVTDKKRNLKISIKSQHLIPYISLLDPKLTITLPPQLTAATGMDALTHAFENLTNNTWNPICDVLSERAIELISNNIRTAVYNGNNKEARYNMLLGSLLAGLAFASTGTGLAHVIAHPLGGHFDIPHGVANAVLLPVVAEYNLWACIDKSIKCAQLMGENTNNMSKWDAAFKCVTAIKKLNSDIGIPNDFKKYRATDEKIKDMAKDALLSSMINVNARKIGYDDIYNVLKIVM